MIEDCNLPATILRPNYFMQNDASMEDALLGKGVYPQPIGDKGVSMVNTRDIAEAAALCLLKRENAAEPLPRETIELVGPDALTGQAIAGNLVRGARPKNPLRRRRSGRIRETGRNLRAALDGP